MSTDLVPADNTTAIDTMPAEKQALAVVDLLDRARHWLADAVEQTGPTEIAAAKAEIVTAATYAKQLGLSKEIQEDGTEMVRRAEYALGKAIRKGQAEGTVTEYGGNRRSSSRPSTLKPTDLASPAELYGGSGPRPTAGIYDLAEAEPEHFDAAITEAKDEGNLSRANVARKVKGQKNGAESRQQRADKIRGLAGRGYSTRQMPEMVGIGREAIKTIAKDFGIDIPADKVIGKTRRHDSNRIVDNVVDELASLYLSLDLIDYDDLDQERAEHWANSLDESFKILNRFRKQIKEMTQ